MKIKFANLDFTPTQINEENKSLRAVFSTADVDRHGEVVDQKSWLLDDFEKNPVVLFGHDHNQPPVGKIIGLGYNANGDLEGEVKFAADEYPFANVIWQLYKGGYMKAFSVGFSAGRVEVVGDQVVLKDNTLYEISTVAVPANQMALAKSKGLSVDALESKMAEMVELAKKPKPTSCTCSMDCPGACVDNPACPCDCSYETEPAMDESSTAEAGNVAVSVSVSVENGTTEKPDTTEPAVTEPVVEQTITLGGPTCRMADESVVDCVARKIPALIAEGMPQDQAVAVANSICSVACSAKTVQTTDKVVDVTDNSVIVRVKNPDYFDADSFRTIDISKSKGIQATTGCKKGKYTNNTCEIGVEIQRYIFDKEKWTPKEAEQWVKDHSKSIETAGLEFADSDEKSVDDIITSAKAGKVLSAKNRTALENALVAIQAVLDADAATVAADKGKTVDAFAKVTIPAIEMKKIKKLPAHSKNRQINKAIRSLLTAKAKA